MQAEPELERIVLSCLPFHASVGVIRAERDSVPPEEALQFPATWSEKRAREHWAGRQAATRALGHFHVSEKVGRAEDGVPLFPKGVVGSIAHTGGRSIVGLCLATQSVGSIGIDIEGRKALAPELIERIVDTEEQALLAGLTGVGSEPGETALWAFCAKEAYYKCVFPSHRRFLGFHDVSFACDPLLRSLAGASPTNSAFAACRLGEKSLGDTLSGRIVLTDEFVVSIVWTS